MVNTEKTRGGAARMASMLIQSLNLDNDIEVTLYHCEDNHISQPFYGLKKFTSRYINAFLARLGGSRCVYDYGVAEQIIKLSADADVLHIHNLHGYYLDWQKLLGAWKGKPVVWTWHDQWGATGRCGFSINCDGWLSGCTSCPHLDYYPTTWFDFAKEEFNQKSKLFQEMANMVIVSPSQWLGDIAIERGVNKSKVKVIANPVDLLAYRYQDKDKCRAELGLPLDKKIALFIAADCNDPRKGYQDFVKITDDLGIYSVAVGKEPTKKGSHVNHLGEFREKETLAKYYAAVDVMVFTSNADNFPNTVIECLACGTPVYAYDVGGVSSQLKEALHCELVDFGEISQFKMKLNQLIERGAKTETISNEIAELAKNKWSAKTAASAYRNLYEQLVINHLANYPRKISEGKRNKAVS